jgi:hypothetical protein
VRRSTAPDTPRRSDGGPVLCELRYRDSRTSERRYTWHVANPTPGVAALLSATDERILAA